MLVAAAAKGSPRISPAIRQLHSPIRSLTETAKTIPAYPKIREFASYICEDTVVEGAGRGFSLQTSKRPLAHVVQVLGVALQGVQRWYYGST